MIERSFDFLILTTQRSGSHMLASTLNSHPDISCEGEVGREDAVIVASPGSISGAILMYSGWRTFGKRFEASKIIHLTRNPANTAKSRLANSQDKKKGKSRLGAHFFEAVDREVTISEKRAGEVEADIRSSINRMRLAIDDIPHIEVSYEDLTGDASVTEIAVDVSRRLTSFLEVSHAKLTTTLVKPNTVYTLQEK